MLWKWDEKLLLEKDILFWPMRKFYFDARNYWKHFKYCSNILIKHTNDKGKMRRMKTGKKKSGLKNFYYSSN